MKVHELPDFPPEGERRRRVVLTSDVEIDVSARPQAGLGVEARHGPALARDGLDAGGAEALHHLGDARPAEEVGQGLMAVGLVEGVPGRGGLEPGAARTSPSQAAGAGAQEDGLDLAQLARGQGQGRRRRTPGGGQRARRQAAEPCPRRRGRREGQESRVNTSSVRTARASSSASPRTPLNASADRMTRERAASDCAGRRRAGSVWASSSRVARPGESRRGRQRAPGSYRVARIIPASSGAVPTRAPSSAAAILSMPASPLRRLRGLSNGWTLPRAATIAESPASYVAPR